MHLFYHTVEIDIKKKLYLLFIVKDNPYSYIFFLVDLALQLVLFFLY